MSMNAGPQELLLLGTPNEDGTWTGVTIDETTSVYLNASQHHAVQIVLIGNGTISGGNVTIEEAFWFDKKTGSAPAQMPYSGTWGSILVVPASDVTGTKQKHIHIDPTAFKFIRVRISDAITGGGGISAVLRYQ